MELKITTKLVKNMSRELRKSNPDLRQGEALDLVSRMLEQPDWNTLSGLLKRETTKDAEAQKDWINYFDWAPLEQLPPVAKPLTLYAEALDMGGLGEGPSFAKIRVDAAFLKLLHGWQTKSLREGLATVKVDADAHVEWEDESEHRLGTSFIEVSSREFYFSALPRHWEEELQTPVLNIKDLHALVAGTQANTERVARIGDVLLLAFNNVGVFAQNLVEWGIVALEEKDMNATYG